MRTATIMLRDGAIAGTMSVKDARALHYDRAENGESHPAEVVVRLPRRHPVALDHRNIRAAYALRGWHWPY